MPFCWEKNWGKNWGVRFLLVERRKGRERREKERRGKEDLAEGVRPSQSMSMELISSNDRRLTALILFVFFSFFFFLFFFSCYFFFFFPVLFLFPICLFVKVFPLNPPPPPSFFLFFPKLLYDPGKGRKKKSEAEKTKQPPTN